MMTTVSTLNPTEDSEKCIWGKLPTLRVITNKQTQNCPIRNGKGLVYFTAFNIKSFESITAETAGDATYPDEKDEGDALLKFEPMNP